MPEGGCGGRWNLRHGPELRRAGHVSARLTRRLGERAWTARAGLLRESLGPVTVRMTSEARGTSHCDRPVAQPPFRRSRRRPSRHVQRVVLVHATGRAAAATTFCQIVGRKLRWEGDKQPGETTIMSRISIDVSPEQHQRLKAMAALQGKSIKEFVLASTLGSQAPDSDEAAALAELETLLDKRLANARNGGVSPRSVGDLVEQVKREAEGTELNG